jgi:hypothetical protein
MLVTDNNFDRSHVGQPHLGSWPGSSERATLITALDAQGVDLKGGDWVSRDETRAMVERWRNDFGAQKYGHLALLPPESGSTLAEVRRGMTPSWASTLSQPVLVLFQEYANVGMLKCDWLVVLGNISQLASVDGNGFVATTPNIDKVFIVDGGSERENAVLAIEAWGSLVSRAGE